MRARHQVALRLQALHKCIATTSQTNRENLFGRQERDRGINSAAIKAPQMIDLSWNGNRRKRNYSFRAIVAEAAPALTKKEVQGLGVPAMIEKSRGVSSNCNCDNAKNLQRHIEASPLALSVGLSALWVSIIWPSSPNRNYHGGRLSVEAQRNSDNLTLERLF